MSLINEYGTKYFHPSMLKENRQKLVFDIAQRDEFKNFSADEIRQKLDYLGNYYKSIKYSSSITWKYFDAMHKVMQIDSNDSGSSLLPSSLSITLAGCVADDEKKTTPNKRGRPKREISFT